MPSKDSLVRAVSFKREEAYMIEELQKRYQPFSFSNCIKALIMKEINGTNNYQIEPFVPQKYQEPATQEVKQRPVVKEMKQEPATVQEEERVKEVIKTEEKHVEKETQQTEAQEQEVASNAAPLQYDLNGDRQELSLDI